jgi:type II secretory pathway component GspD/PulD (secretin)
MKKILFTLTVLGFAGLLVSAQAQPTPPDDTNTPDAADQPAPPTDLQPPPDEGAMQNPPDTEVNPAANAETGTATAPAQAGESAVITASEGKSGPRPMYQSGFLPPSKAVGTNVNDINLNYNNAPLDMVLNYLSDAGGFIIVQDTRISSSSKVTVNGKHLTRDEVVDLLSSVLNKNGLAAIRDGRTLTIVDKSEAKTREIPVKSGNNPDLIPRNAEIVTQIIPIRFVDARQLVSDLSSFVSPQATVVANEAGNSIVITDTQANIRHVAEIIRAIDNSAEAETEIRVFPLKHASPADVATELASVFPSSSSGNSAQAPTRFGGGGGGPGGLFRQMMANAGGASSGANADRVRKATAVTAVADSRIQAVIVTAPKDLMEEIDGVVKSLDVASDRDQNVYVFRMNNGDPQQVAQVLQNMFQSTSSRTTSGQNQNSALQQRATTATTTTSQNMNSSGFGSSSFGGSSGRGGTGGGF